MFMLVAKMAQLRGAMTEEEVRSYIAELQKVPEKMQAVLDRRKEIHVIAKEVLES